MSRRLVAWIALKGPLGRAFADPSICGETAPDADSLIDAVLIPRRLQREQQAAGIEVVRRAGREAWHAHHREREAS